MSATAIAPEAQEKTCIECGESWPADREFFDYAPHNPDGLSYKCLACRCWRKQSGAKYGALTKELSLLLANFIQKTKQPTHANT